MTVARQSPLETSASASSADDAVVYLNGAFVPRHEAVMPLEDRGALFADGVYEVTRYFGGRSYALRRHLDRLRRSLAGIELPAPTDVDRLEAISDDAVRRNGLADARVYWHVTRGAAPRNHLFPREARPTVLVIAYPDRPLDTAPAPRAMTAVFAEDERWAGCWIKSLMLLPNVLAKNRAAAAGADEAILHRDGRVTEGSSTNVFIARDGELITHPADRWILNGITRQIVIERARELGVTVHERPFSPDELLHADEAFFCGTTVMVRPITRVDDRAIGDGKTGPLTARLYTALVNHVTDECGLD